MQAFPPHLHGYNTFTWPCKCFPDQGPSLRRIQADIVHNYSVKHICILSNNSPQFRKRLEDFMRTVKVRIDGVFHLYWCMASCCYSICLQCDQLLWQCIWAMYDHTQYCTWSHLVCLRQCGCRCLPMGGEPPALPGDQCQLSQVENLHMCLRVVCPVSWVIVLQCVAVPWVTATRHCICTFTFIGLALGACREEGDSGGGLCREVTVWCCWWDCVPCSVLPVGPVLLLVERSDIAQYVFVVFSL